MAAFLMLAISSAWVLPLTSKNWKSVLAIGAGVQSDGDPNHFSRMSESAASPGVTAVMPSRLKPAAHGAPAPQAVKHPTAMRPTANRRSNWVISQYRPGRLVRESANSSSGEPGARTAHVLLDFVSRPRSSGDRAG